MRASVATLESLEPGISERLRKLEELVVDQNLQQIESARQRSEISDTHQEQADRLTQSPRFESLDDDVAWLESFYTDQQFSVSIICLATMADDVGR